MSLKTKRVHALAASLNQYRDEYYNENSSVPDAVYDRLYDELQDLTGIILSNFPTQTVGYKTVSALTKQALISGASKAVRALLL